MAATEHPYYAFSRDAGRDAVNKAADWSFDSRKRPDLSEFLKRMSDKQLQIFQGFAMCWEVDVALTLRFLPEEQHAKTLIDIECEEAKFVEVRAVIQAEVIARGIQEVPPLPTRPEW